MLSPILSLKLHRLSLWIPIFLNENPLILIIDILNLLNEGSLFQKYRPCVISIDLPHIISEFFVLSLNNRSFELRHKHQRLIFKLLVKTQDAEHAPLFHVVQMVQDVV